MTVKINTTAHNNRPFHARYPTGMERVQINRDDAHAIQNMALEIFADVTGCGRTFQDAITAVYLSGLQHGIEVKTGA